jgi:hypothetical protein
MPKKLKQPVSTGLRADMERLAKLVPTGPMDVDEIAGCLDVLGWHAVDLIKALGYDPYHGAGRGPIFRWVSGASEIPLEVGNWLRAHTALVSTMPPPPKTSFVRGRKPSEALLRRRRKMEPAELDNLLQGLSKEEREELMEEVA